MPIEASEITEEMTRAATYGGTQEERLATLLNVPETRRVVAEAVEREHAANARPSVVIRRYPDAVTVLVDGRIVVSGSNDDMPGEQPLSPVFVAGQVAADVARALGATVHIEVEEGGR